MKRRILAVLFSFLALFAFTACVNGTEEHKHEYGEWTVETPATCTQAGEKRQYCSCGEYKTDEIPALGHEFLHYISDGNATCTEDGTKTAQCERCNETDTIPEAGTKLDHSFINYISDGNATCTEDGTKTAKCERCNEKKTVTDKDSALGHKFDNFVCSVCGQQDPEAPVTEILEYSEITENGETVAYCVTGMAGDANYIQIPSTHNGKPVTSIGESAFYNCENLQSVSVGDGVTLIGELAFADCYMLKAVTLGKNVKTIDGYAFSQCSMLRQINFPSGLETIGECAFVSCVSLERADLNDGLKSIDDCAFAGCSSIESFIIPNSVTRTGFGIIMFETGGGFEGIGFVGNKLTQVVMSDSLTEVSQFAFSHSNIKSILIGKNVQTIDYSSFYGCALLESVVIPKSVTKITSYAFYQCEALKEVYYCGTAEEWAKIKIGKNGNDITKEEVTRYFYSETRPEAEGNFWHYVNGEITIW